MNEKLLADYIRDQRSIKVSSVDVDSYFLKDNLVSVYIILESGENDVVTILLLDIIAWVYSKRGKCNCGGRLI